MIRKLLMSREAALLLVLFILFATFSVWVDGFLDWFNMFERSRYWVVPGMIAVPMTFIIATAGIDLSVGSMVALSGIVLGLLYRDAGWPVALAVAAAVGTGLVLGLFNGAISSYGGVPPLVVTLATMALFRGVAMGLSQAQPVANLPVSFQWLAQGNLFTLPIGRSGVVFVPAPLLALIVAGILGALALRHSWVGRFAESIGENEVAARFAAIDVRRLKCALYTACGVVCGLAAVFHTALYATAKADTAKGLELEVIACVVVGGTRISGGRGSVVGSLLGLLIIGMLRYGLEMAGIKSQHVVLFVGGLLILTAVFNEWLAARTGEKL